ncbi:ligninase h2 precursor [Echria macrotheca]|uniref:Peroxidase n=1 Tax=Echria macrotheca TaxID=438768 RepID=A0AAJ0B3E5_9PEZI|nr:ligninase h2 precursor [Echria macrotheca]
MKVWVLVASLAGSAVAFPSLKDLQAAVSRRQFSGSTELLGDLATLPPGELSDVGKEIKAILLGHTEGRSSEGYRAPAFDSPQCRKDECCVWKYIADELYSLMHDDATDTCNDFARGAIRMGFHDAAAWDKTSPWGGADGSLLLSNELTRQENIAMTGVGARMKAIYDKYTSYGISMADLLQAGAKVGVLACPGGPRIRMFVGRPEDKTPAPVGLLPPVFFTADQLIDLFANKTVSPGGLVALIGAHTASRNHSAASTVAPPQDRTPGKWDTEYFSEQLRPNASAGVFRFPSDVSLAQSPRTGPVFHQFSAAKGAWDEAYAKEYIRMSLMGVKKINTLRECSKVLPKAANKLEPDEPEPSSTPSRRLPLRRRFPVSNSFRNTVSLPQILVFL